MRTAARVSRIAATRPRFGRGQTLLEVLCALSILAVLFVFVTADLTNVTNGDRATDNTLEISAANYLLGFMKQDQNFWGVNGGGNDWGSGPTDLCGDSLGAYTDTGPSPAPNWKSLPPGCQGYEQPFTGPNNSIQYMWNAAPDTVDPVNAADLTVWIRRDGSSPVFEYHGLRYQYPASSTPTPQPTATPSPTPSSSPSTPPPSPSPGPTKSPAPPTPTPSPTGYGV